MIEAEIVYLKITTVRIYGYIKNNANGISMYLTFIFFITEYLKNLYKNISINIINNTNIIFDTIIQNI